MTTYTITGEDTLTLYDRVFNDLADDDVSNIAYANDKVTLKTGKNGNTIYALNEQGKNAEMTLRLIRGSSDDRFLLGKINQSDLDFVGTVLANGQFVKRLGDGQGNISLDTATLKGGIITRNIESKENVSGDTVQGVAIYTIKFAIGKRDIQ